MDGPGTERGWQPDPRYLRLTDDAVFVRPRQLTRVVVVVDVVLLAVFAGLAVTLGSSVGTARLSDKLALFGLGVVVAGVVLLLARPRVQADRDGVTVRTIAGEQRLAWSVVRAVVVKDGTPWATLDLHDDEQVSLLAVQTADGPQATAAIRALRRLHQAGTHQTGPDRPGPGPEQP